MMMTMMMLTSRCPRVHCRPKLSDQELVRNAREHWVKGKSSLTWEERE
jgi:hypothetical protein